MTKLAVIQSIYKNDKAEYLIKSVDSILNQTFSNFTYFIGVDGPIGSDLRNVIDSITDDRIVIIENEENKGLASILNDLLEKCKEGDFDYIARMDSDDIATQNRFELQIDHLEQNADVDALGGAINEIDENGNERDKITRYPCTPKECRAFFAKRNPLAHPTVMFRSSFFEKAGWQYPTDFVRNEDTRLWHEGFKHGCVIANISEVVLNFRMTDSMFTQRRNGREFAKSQLELRKMIAKDLRYGMMAYIYAYAMYLLMISPSWILKIAYKVLR